MMKSSASSNPSKKTYKKIHRYPIIFQKTGIPLEFEREKFDFLKSDFVRFLFLTWIVIQSQTEVALRSVTVEVYYRQAKEQVLIIQKYSSDSITSLPHLAR